MVGILRGGGLDCSKLSDDNFSLEDVKDKTGVWMRIAPFMDWIKERIYEETYPGMEKCFIQKL